MSDRPLVVAIAEEELDLNELLEKITFSRLAVGATGLGKDQRA